MNSGRRIFPARVLAERVEGRLVGSPDVEIGGVNTVEEAGPGDITFIADARYARSWESCAAGAAVVTDGLEPAGYGGVGRGEHGGGEHEPGEHEANGPGGTGRALIFVPDAELAMATVLGIFQPEEVQPDLGVSAGAWVHDSAVIGADVRIAPQVTIDRGCRLGDGVVLHAGVHLYAHVTIGAGSILHGGCVVRQGCRLGRRIVLHQNVSIGADGFGYRASPEGSGLVKIPHIGDVRIEDDVEIGAGSCIDRAKFGTTLVGAGTKIDNLVQIGHNCRIGPAVVIAGATTVGGSTVVGEGALIAGGVTISDHTIIGKGARLGGCTSVKGTVPEGETWLGTPGRPIAHTLREWAAIRMLPRLIRRLPKSAEVQERPRPEKPANEPQIDGPSNPPPSHASGGSGATD